MSHTPGPWLIQALSPNRKYYGTRIAIGNDELTVWTPGRYESGASEREIANGWEPQCGFDHVETAECYANARLIAAAPELLEALRFISEHSGDSGLRKVARAAIAKAEGK